MRGIMQTQEGITAVLAQQRLAAGKRLAAWGVLGVVGWMAAFVPLSARPAEAQNKPEAANTKAATATLAGLQDAFAAVADELEQVVVTVSSFKSARSSGDSESGVPFRGIVPFGRSGAPHRAVGTGSGVIISKDGWILTNDHVAGGADKVTVKLHDGREFVGTVRRDSRSDLALVKISAPSPLPAARLGDSDKIRVGYWAVAIGSPYRYEGSVSVGVISSLYRSQHIFDMDATNGERYYPNMIQTDAAINPGNSGGPLCNINGEVIGINTAIESENGGSIGIGFAIPINTAKFVIAQLLDKGHVSYGYLGVSPTSVTPRLASTLKVDQGALIELDPEANSPAAKAGMHAGDVVVAINKKPVHNEIDLRTIIAQTAPGTQIELSIMRDGQEHTLKTVLAEAPETATQEKPHPPAKTRLGIEVQPLTQKLAEQAGVPVNTPGVVIKSIDPDSAAADAERLTEGCVILKVNDTETPTVQAFQAATANLKSGDQVKIWYWRTIEGKKIKGFVIVSVD